MCACVCPDIYVSASMYIICMCIQTHKAEQALLVYTATESLSHNSQLLFSNCVTLCSAWLLKSATWMPLFGFKHNSINLWFSVSFQIFHWKWARDTREMSHIHISCSCRIPSDGVTWISRWCHMDLFWIKWNARQLSYGVMWSHVRPIADSSRSEHNWKSKTALIFESIGRSFWG